MVFGASSQTTHGKAKRRAEVGDIAFRQASVIHVHQLLARAPGLAPASMRSLAAVLAGIDIDIHHYFVTNKSHASR